MRFYCHSALRSAANDVLQPRPSRRRGRRTGSTCWTAKDNRDDIVKVAISAGPWALLGDE